MGLPVIGGLLQGMLGYQPCLKGENYTLDQRERGVSPLAALAWDTRQAQIVGSYVIDHGLSCDRTKFQASLDTVGRLGSRLRTDLVLCRYRSIELGQPL
ncbi:hypothetical protein RRG08_044271 [Elysia crispata]|uniref:Uncharacterized protein n=1 Tax=Elysia crispata TaxID=231223 RepID=A0AAE0XWY4_9GAST|nr:hypothetical protein RRG08_044271 [Elysia crispata]